MYNITYRAVKEHKEQEEQRLFYMGITRAKKRLMITYNTFRNEFYSSKLSEYVHFIPSQY